MEMDNEFVFSAKLSKMLSMLLLIVTFSSAVWAIAITLRDNRFEQRICSLEKDRDRDRKEREIMLREYFSNKNELSSRLARLEMGMDLLLKSQGLEYDRKIASSNKH